MRIDGFRDMNLKAGENGLSAILLVSEGGQCNGGKFPCCAPGASHLADQVETVLVRHAQIADQYLWMGTIQQFHCFGRGAGCRDHAAGLLQHFDKQSPRIDLVVKPIWSTSMAAGLPWPAAGGLIKPEGPRRESRTRGGGLLWAGLWPPAVLVSDRFCRQPRSRAWARLGPLSVTSLLMALSHRRSAATVSAAAATQRGGLAVSRLDGRGLSRRTDSRPGEGARAGSREETSRSRTLFLGSRDFCRPLPAVSVVLGPACRVSRVSHPAVRHATGGDINPDCLAGVFAPRRVALSLAAGPGRARH